ncbi:peptidase S8/S53 domain-containing protein [Catenaria anguillulae PL171]|uniref:Peptidase S8/S53 domain-containing protein n=1 Tax=Catenaria anguillulae PL171 TaxID=765915 RepID=A0A1Y2HHK3_9FUNG|nr:peptidase S8/S53 domain-containing protein [Catenaria anguillulae PL171]
MKLLALIATIGLALVSSTSPTAAAPTVAGAQSQVVPNQYIITLKPTANLSQFSRALQSEMARERESNTVNGGIVPKFGQQVLIGSSFKAVTGTMTDDMVRKLKANSQVASVEPDYIVQLFETTQLNPPSWGLGRISSRSGVQGYYSFPDKQGEGVDVYVIDTGVRPGHPEFRGFEQEQRAKTAFKVIGGSEPEEDQNGHGTHVAGTIAGVQFGVAKRARIRAIKILDRNGFGRASDAVWGMALAASEIRTSGKTAVCNMSFGFYANQTPASDMTALDQAAAALFEAGCVIVKAAGNWKLKVYACTAAPGRVPQGLTVAALSAKGDALASYSNIGRCVNIAAPGNDIVSAGLGGRNANATLSGTSMAAPHVAGAAALILGQEPQLTPQQVVDRIISRAIVGVIKGDLKGGANRVLYVSPQ